MIHCRAASELLRQLHAFPSPLHAYRGLCQAGLLRYKLPHGINSRSYRTSSSHKAVLPPVPSMVTMELTRACLRNIGRCRYQRDKGGLPPNSQFAQAMRRHGFRVKFGNALFYLLPLRSWTGKQLPDQQQGGLRNESA